ncbi:hypothetical protein GW17_00025844, partial [Ensete ventricosum]
SLRRKVRELRRLVPGGRQLPAAALPAHRRLHLPAEVASASAEGSFQVVHAIMRSFILHICTISLSSLSVRYLVI